VYETFEVYRLHLKVLHNKRTQGDKLVCGQNGCPLDYLSFQSLKNHCVKHHGLAAAEEQAGEKSSSSVGSANAVECENINSPSEASIYDVHTNGEWSWGYSGLRTGVVLVWTSTERKLNVQNMLGGDF
jgi:hypothetical protein